MVRGLHYYHTCMVAAEILQQLPRDRSKPIHRWVYEVIRLNIIQLHLQPGRLLSETEMADLLEVSRTPVREAFIRLAEDGLLEILPQRGSVVSLIDLQQAQEARFIRYAVEREILKEVCTGHPADLTALEGNLSWQEESGDKEDFDLLLLADNEYHRILYRICGKEGVWDSIKRLDYNYDRLRVMTFPRAHEKIIEEHREILQMVKSREKGRIEDLLHRHLTWDVIREVVFEYPAEYFKALPVQMSKASRQD
ncbi:MAG: GntR family transcriptional regulator [Spirochaetales bacterium]